MSLYKFLDNEEKMVKVALKNYAEATQYAKENNLLSLTMDYKNFVSAFENKVEKFKDHPKYEWLKEQAGKAITFNCACGLQAIKANDFMERIITLPTAYITEWLDGKNQLEWLEDYK